MEGRQDRIERAAWALVAEVASHSHGRCGAWGCGVPEAVKDLEAALEGREPAEAQRADTLERAGRADG